MSFEDLDSNFEKVAKTPIKTNVQRETEAERLARQDKRELYEESFKEKPLPGLLAVFQEKLKNRSLEPAEGSDEYETIHITSNAVIPTAQDTTAEVSEEDINKLMNPKKPKYSEGFDNIDTSVEQTISTHTRYDATHPVIENTIKEEDLSKQQTTLNEGDRPTIQRTASEQISDEEVTHHLVEHNRKKAERKAAEAAKVIPTSEKTSDSETE